MATLFPFGPSFQRAPYEVTREYRTEIITSRSGKEQRRALRQTPRKRVEYVAPLCDENTRAFDAAMVAAQRIPLSIAERVRYVEFAAGLPAGFGAVVIDPVPWWIYTGAVLVLVGGIRHDFRTVTSVTGTTVAFAETDLVARPPGSFLAPPLTGYLDPTIPAPLTSRSHNVVEASITFHVDPGDGEDVEPIGTAAATFNGRELFLPAPDRIQEITIDRVQDGAALVDYGFGRTRWFFPIPFATRMWEAQYTACDWDHADDIRAFFDRMKGRQHEFYAPTWQEDMVPVSGVTAAGATLTVEGTLINAAFDPSTTYKAIALRKKSDSSWIARAVSTITAGSSSSTLTLTAAWGQTVAREDIDRVSWLPVWRFASDTMTMSWFRKDAAHVKLAFQLLENLAAEA